MNSRRISSSFHGCLYGTARSNSRSSFSNDCEFKAEVAEKLGSGNCSGLYEAEIRREFIRHKPVSAPAIFPFNKTVVVAIVISPRHSRFGFATNTCLASGSNITS